MLCDLATFADLSSLLPKPDVEFAFSPSAPLKTHLISFFEDNEITDSFLALLSSALQTVARNPRLEK